MGGFKGKEIEYNGDMMNIKNAIENFLKDYELHFNEDGAYSQLMAKGKKIDNNYQQAFDDWCDKMKRKFNR